MLIVKREPATGRIHLVGEADKLATAANQYLATLVNRGYSPLTVKSYAFAITRFHRWFARSTTPFEKLRQSDLVPYIAELRTDGAQPRTINHRLTVVRALYDFVVGRPMEWGGGPRSSNGQRGGRYDRLGLHWVKTKQAQVLRVKTPHTIIEPLTPDQVEAFLKTFHRYRDLALTYMMLLCGLRSREVLDMRLNDINTVDRCLRVRGKGNKERVVPLPALLETTLSRYLRLERPRQSATDHVFVVLQGSQLGRPMTTGGLRSLFRARRRQPRLNNANPHRLRHTFGADMARAGISLAVLQRLMGHVHPDTTMRYVNLSMRDIDEAYRRALDVIAREQT